MIQTALGVQRDLVKSLSTLYQSLHRHLATWWLKVTEFTVTPNSLYTPKPIPSIETFALHSTTIASAFQQKKTQKFACLQASCTMPRVSNMCSFHLFTRSFILSTTLQRVSLTSSRQLSHEQAKHFDGLQSD